VGEIFLKRRIAQIAPLVALQLMATIASAQSGQFAGKWQTRSGGSKEITLTVSDKEKLDGSLFLANPNGASSELALINPVINGRVLNFQTVDDGTMMVWKLTISSGGKSAKLQGFDRRAGKFGKDNGEMSVVLKLYKSST
jgi:hypothetical protein